MENLIPLVWRNGAVSALLNSLVPLGVAVPSMKYKIGL
jgi:hypothetical protein